jgi:hypothetical protein
MSTLPSETAARSAASSRVVMATLDAINGTQSVRARESLDIDFSDDPGSSPHVLDAKLCKYGDLHNRAHDGSAIINPADDFTFSTDVFRT